MLAAVLSMYLVRFWMAIDLLYTQGGKGLQEMVACLMLCHDVYTLLGGQLEPFLVCWIPK